MANLSPPDLMRFWAWICPLARNKIEIPAYDKGAKPRGYAPGDNIDLWCFLHTTAGAEHHQEESGVRECYETYKNKTQLEFEFDLRCHNSQ